MSDWKETRLGDIIEIKSGFSYKGESIGSGERILLGMGCVSSNKKFLFSGARLYNGNVSDKYLVNPGDLVLATRQQSDNLPILGQPAIIPNELSKKKIIVGTNLYSIKNHSDISNKFLYWLLKSPAYSGHILSAAKGTTVKMITKDAVESFKFFCPSKDERESISEVLSSLDDKIDLLHKQNQTLEQLAETIFRQWFVEDADGSWETCCLGDLVVIKRGGSPRPIQEFISQSGLRWLKISDATSGSSPYIFETKEYIKESGLSKTVLLKEGSLILSNSATPGIPKILKVDCCIHDGWLYFPKSKFSNEFLYLFFKSIRNDLLQLGNGSIFTNLKTDILKEYKIVVPPNEILESFQNAVDPLFSKLFFNSIQIRQLEQTRDILLPRLMSGAVRVNN